MRTLQEIYKVSFCVYLHKWMNNLQKILQTQMGRPFIALVTTYDEPDFYETENN